MPSTIYVGNLAYSVSSDDLQELFSQAGQVERATVITDKFSGQSRGFGFVEMTTAQEVADAIRRFNDAELKGKNIKVNEARPRESNLGNPDRSGGGANPQPLMNAGPAHTKARGRTGQRRSVYESPRLYYSALDSRIMLYIPPGRSFHFTRE